MDYADYQHLTFDLKPNGVLLITINRPEVLNATNARLHWELTQVWGTIDADSTTRVALVTGAGKAFSAGGDLEPGRGDRHEPRGRRAHHARGQRSRLQHDQPRQARRLRHQRGGGGGRSGGGAPGRRQHHRRRRPASPTATRASAWPPAITRPSSGRCSAGWPRPSTTCSPATSSTAARPSASGW